MNILRFCVASNKESLKWTGVQLFGVTFDKVPTGFIRIHAGKNPNTSSIRHKMGLEPPRVLTSFMHVSWYRAASTICQTSSSPSLSCFFISLNSPTKLSNNLFLYSNS